MSKTIEKSNILDIENHKLFLLYREKLEKVITELNCSVEKIQQINYKFSEDDDFDNNYLSIVDIYRKWHLKSILPESLKLLIPSTLDLTTYHDKAVWTGVDYDFCKENNLLETLSEEKQNNYSCKFEITPTENPDTNFYNIIGEIYFKKHNDNQTRFEMKLTLNLNYDLLKSKFSNLGMESTFDKIIDKLVDLISTEVEKNMNLIANQISEKYK